MAMAERLHDTMKAQRIDGNFKDSEANLGFRPKTFVTGGICINYATEFRGIGGRGLLG